VAAPTLLDKESLNTALKYIWGQYRTWDLTSVALKNRLVRWRDIVLLLSVSGAILGTLSQQIDAWRIAALPTWLAATLGVLSGAALGLAAYFTKEVLSPEPEAAAVRTRAAAEAFKREAYLLATGVPPYTGATTADGLLEKSNQIRASVENIAPVTVSSTQQQDGLPAAGMSVDDYVKQRLDQQVDEYYLPQARRNAQKLALGRKISFVLGAIALLLGLWSARSASVAGWVAVIGTITAAITARQYAGRYQFLIVSYQATADRLQWLKTKWELEGKNQPGDDAKNTFITATEDAIATENSAWMAEWTKKQDE
jgi:SMODS and SLOG-associating 2TM effector domain 1